MTNLHIDFLLNVDAEGIHFGPHRPEGIEFIPKEGDSLRFVLYPDDLNEFFKKLICKVYKSYGVTENQAVFVDSFNTRRVMCRVAENISLPYKPEDRILIDEDGAWVDGFSPRRYLCPLDIQKLIEDVEAELLFNANRFFKLLRWRQNCDAPSEILKHYTLYWRVGEGDYHLVPFGSDPFRKTIVQGMFGINWSKVHLNDLQELWIEKDMVEPLGHTLLREAITLSEESPRSSILIMTAAIETAVKIHISRIAPHTEWLLSEMPSPPVFRILRDYVPLIHSKLGKELDFWDQGVKTEIKKLQKLIEVRNKIAHTGKIPEDIDPIQDYITLVSDLLYLLDVLDGQEWAKSLLSSNFRKKLGWPEPKDTRVTIKIKTGY